MKNQIHKNGFTLFELLVVISIIGILSSFLLANFIGVRQRARDSQRKSDLSSMQTALELHRSDLGRYPTTAQFAGYTCNPTTSFADSGVVYMTKIPCDPSEKTPYTYVGTTSTYSITACLENTSDGQKDASNSCPAASGKWSYTVSNP